MPGETNRRIVDIISDVNLAYSQHARRYLAECGLPKERTYVTGSPMAEALDKSCFVLSGIDTNGLLQAVELAVSMNETRDYGIPVPDYTDINVSSKVVRIIQSYTGIVNCFVWRKPG